MTDSEQREAARQFANKWKNGGDEKQDCHSFWIDLLTKVIGVIDITDYIQFEKPVKLKEADGKIHTRYIDGYIPDVKVLIEQKGSTHRLDVKEHQSGGEELTPFEQAKRYNDNIAHSENARWIVTCNFTDIWIYDMENPTADPTQIETVELQQKYPMLDFLVKKDVKQISHEMEVSIQAGDIVGLLYDAFLKQYNIPERIPKDESDEDREKRENKLKSLNALCVRLVFCLYAEDAGIFERNQFHDYLEPFPVSECRRALIDLFAVLDTKIEERDEFLEENLKAFPYVNGGLFADEKIQIPQFSDEIKDVLLEKASADFNWRDISPTIFGAVFESTLNPQTRRAGGMHYTSIENIHKVIDLLFLDDLKAEFDEISRISVSATRRQKLLEFQDKLASLTFLDPACGSGNFLTETYLSLRRLENQAIRKLSDMDKKQVSGQISFGGTSYPIRVSIHQFYGIEINDFAVTVAKTALWIAESQMLDETKNIEYLDVNFLPLKTYVNITEGNALRIDWNEVVPKENLNYIMGNPPFVGARLMTSEQKSDVNSLFKGWKNIGNLDYVSCWYKKAADFISDTDIHAALVSTNSITQGESVADLWKPLFKQGIHIDFAWRTFRWDSEANIKAHVHCVIVGFSETAGLSSHKKIYVTTYKKDGNGKNTESFSCEDATNINGYLIDAENIFIDSRTKPICDVPEIGIGNKPIDGGFYIFDKAEMKEFIEKEPASREFFHEWYGSREFINRCPRYCLWLGDCTPAQLRKMPECMKRIEAVREYRLNSTSAGTRKLADRPTHFHVENMPDTTYVVIPEVSSQRRRYVPMGFMTSDVMCSNKVRLMPDATLYHFGGLESNVHMAWMRMVCGRLKSDYDYSIKIVYNNFPWPSTTDSQKQLIEKTAQGILDARALYPDSSLADLYDPLTMPPELRKAHTANDIAVMKAYGFDTKMTEADCVAELMNMYQRLTSLKQTIIEKR